MKKRGWLRRLLSLLAVAVLLLGFWEFENNTIDSETWTVYSPVLPAAFSGFRIVELADLHSKEFGNENERLLRAVQRAKPDLIAIDGDLLDEHSPDISWVKDFCQALVEIAPTFFVTGNHEWRLENRQALFDTLEQAGVTVLHNDYQVVSLGASRIIVAGVDDPNGPYDMKTPAQLLEEIRQQYPRDFLVVLAHRNDQMPMWQALAPDLVLAGHGHGGIIRLPFVGGLIDRDGTLFQPYSGGLYRLGKTQVAVSRGLGNARGCFRLLNRPHLPVIVLQATSQSLTNHELSEISLQVG